MRTTLLKRIIAAVLLLCAPAATASTQDTRNVELTETGLWNGVYLKLRFTERLGYYAEHHLRYRNSQENVRDFVGRTRQVYNRAGVNVFVNDKFEFVVGPTLVLNFTPEPGNPNFERITLEPRIWHQWLFATPVGRAKINHQLRFEHRWKRSNDVGASHDYTDRYRYKFFAYVPINRKTIEEGTWFVSPSAEVFMHSGRTIVNNPLEDFRTYNGIGYVLNRRVTFFGGHMWTFGQRPTGNDYATSHIIRLNVFLGFDFRDLAGRLPPINLGY